MSRQLKVIISCAVALAAAVPATSYAGYQDDNSGCRIVLCLANPKGPMAAAECVNDIKELFHQRTLKHPNIPSCKDAENSGTFYKFRNDHYSLCPTGTTDSRSVAKLTGANVFVLDAQTAATLPKNNGTVGSSNRGVVRRPGQQLADNSAAYVLALAPYLNNPSSSGSATSASVADNWFGGQTSLACVAGSGQASKVCLEKDAYGRCARYGTVYQYGTVVRKPYKASPQVVDVYVSNKIWHRTRLNGDNAEIEQTYYPQ